MKNESQDNLLVEAGGLTKVFKDFWNRPKVLAVNDVSFAVRRGEVFGLLGPNGSGKSTIIKMILGLLYPSSGKLTVFGASPRSVDSKMRIGYLPEESYVYPYLTPVEILDFYSSLFDMSRAERKKRVSQLLEMIGLAHTRNRPVGEFSKGMMRRIGLAQALVNDPDLVILDEPTSGLDPVGRRQVKDLIVALAKRNKTVLVSSHLLAEIEDVCDRVVILFNGNTLVQGGMKELLEEADNYRLTFKTDSPAKVDSVAELVRQQLEVDPALDHPRRSLEQFFLSVVEKAGKGTVRLSGASQAGGVARYLSGETE